MTIQKCIDKALSLIGMYSEGGIIVSEDDPRYIDMKYRMISAIDTAQMEISDHLRHSGEFNEPASVTKDSDLSDELSLPEFACAPIPYFAAACCMLTVDIAVSDRLMELFYQKLENLPYGERYTAVKNGFFI